MNVTKAIHNITQHATAELGFIHRKATRLILF